MSHLTVDSILPAEVYNSLIIDHEATEKAELIDLKHKHLPYLSNLLVTHGVADFVELHLLHRHFTLQEGEALVHKVLEIPATENLRNICVDVAKALICPESVKSRLVPLLWMASSGSGTLVAYEYGLLEATASAKRAIDNLSSAKWNSFAQEFNTYVHSAGIADIVSLKDRTCITGGEYVVPSMRVLFRMPTEAISLQKGSEMLESGWQFDPAAEADTNFPECTDGHVTKTRQTSGGTVAHYHATTEDGVDAFNEKEVAHGYTSAMWNAAKSQQFWAMGRLVDTVA